MLVVPFQSRRISTASKEIKIKIFPLLEVLHRLLDQENKKYPKRLKPSMRIDRFFRVNLQTSNAIYNEHHL
jgi:hypothetical protein